MQFLIFPTVFATKIEVEYFDDKLAYLNKESIEYAKGSDKYSEDEESSHNHKSNTKNLVEKHNIRSSLNLKSENKTKTTKITKRLNNNSDNTDTLEETIATNYTQRLPVDNLVDSTLAYLDPESIDYREASSKKSKVKSSAKTTTKDQIKTVIESDSVEAEYEAATTSEINSELQSDVQSGEESGSIESSQEDPEKYARQDPLIEYNRSMYYINKKLDKFVIKPPAQVYSYVIPSPVRHMVTNFYSNIQDINVLINDFLQSEMENSVDTIYRVFLNSTFGIFGLIDVAAECGFPKRANDFGVTFGRWFFEESSYFIIPIIGPSTIRDTAGTAIGAALSFGYYLPEEYIWPFTGVYFLDKRSNLLTTEKIIDTVAADDEYVFVRNAYLDYRSRLIKGETISRKDELKEQELLEDIVSDDNSVGDLDSLEKLDDLEELDDLE